MRRIGYFGLLALLGVWFGLATLPAFGQGDEPIVSIELNQAEIRYALKLLFEQTGFNYSIDPAIQGTVTVRLKDVPFSVALRNILSQVKASYRVVGGIYEIVMREETVLPPPDVGYTETPDVTTTTERVVRIPIYHADPNFVLGVISGRAPTVPEITTLQGMGGGYGGFGGGGYGGFGGMMGGFGGGYGGFGGGYAGFGGGYGSGFGGGFRGGFGGGYGGFGGGYGGLGGGYGGYGGGYRGGGGIGGGVGGGGWGR